MSQEFLEREHAEELRRRAGEDRYAEAFRIGQEAARRDLAEQRRREAEDWAESLVSEARALQEQRHAQRIREQLGQPAPMAEPMLDQDNTDPEEAARRLEPLLEQHPREAAAANELAGILAERGDLERARVYAARAAWFALPEAQETLARIKKLRAAAPAASDPDEQDESKE